MNKLKILHINTLDNQGGASQVAVDLLLNPDTESRLVVMKKTINNHQVIELKKKIFDFVFKVSDKILWSLGQRKSLRALLSLDNEMNFTYDKLRKMKVYREADIIHLHNLHGGYFDFNTFLKIAKEKKIVWTLHDMWAITGGEANTFGNENFKKGIGDTPYIKHYPLMNPIIDRRQYFLKRKKRIYSKIRDVITIVPASEWLNKCFSEAYVYDPGLRLHCIHNGVDTTVFKNKMLRTWEKPRILFFNLDNPFKGGHLLINILEKIENEFDLYVIGEKLKIKFPHTYYQYITDRKRLSEVYNHSDILIFPSLAENFPLTVLEAMACGVCVIASDTGGIPEMLDNSCGFLFKNNDGTFLLNTIETSLKDIKSVREKGKLAETRVLENFTLEINFKNYVNLYNDIFRFNTWRELRSQSLKSKKPLKAIDFFN